MEFVVKNRGYLLLAGVLFFFLMWFQISAVAYAECGDSLSSAQMNGFQPQFTECGKITNDTDRESCIQDFYITPCIRNKVNNEKVDQTTAQRACIEEVYQCGQLTSQGSSGTQTPPPSGSSTNPPAGSLGSSGNCGEGFESVNGVCVPKSGFNSGSLAASKSWQDLVLQVLKILLTLAGVVAVVAIVIGGFWYITSGGNEETAEKGKKMLINAVIGLAIIILAFTIVTVVTNLFTKGTV